MKITHACILGFLATAGCAVGTLGDGASAPPAAASPAIDAGLLDDGSSALETSKEAGSIAVDSGSTTDAAVPVTSLTDAGAFAAVLQLNEINPNVAGSSDLIELLVLAAGNTLGITVEQNIAGPLVLATLPAIAVSAGDLVVVHLNAPSGVATEASAKGACADASCFAGAWDVVGGTAGITYSGRVMLVRDPAHKILDGVAFYRSGAASPGAFAADVQALQTASSWLPALCGGSPCSTNALAESVAADWANCGTASTGESVARVHDANTTKAADWSVGASSFGAANP